MVSGIDLYSHVMTNFLNTDVSAENTSKEIDASTAAGDAVM